MFGFNHKKSSSTPERCIQGVEALEERLMKAADIDYDALNVFTEYQDTEMEPGEIRTYDFFGSEFLLVKGTSADDDVSFSFEEGFENSPEHLVVRFNGITVRPVQQGGNVDAIMFWGHEGADKYTNNTSLDAVAFGGIGSDVLTGGDGLDYLSGGEGADRLNGRGGNDFLEGGLNNDRYLYSGATNLGEDVIIEKNGEGNDLISFRTFAEGVRIDLSKIDTVQTVNSLLSLELCHEEAIERVIGTNYRDTLRGNSLRNGLAGLGENDTLEGRGGNDRTDGGLGDDKYVYNEGQLGRDTVVDATPEDGLPGDQLNFDGMTTGVRFDMGSVASQRVNENLRIQLTTADAIEGVRGTDFNDSITTNDRINIVETRDGNDTITLRGEANLVDGGKGNDRYVFELDEATTFNGIYDSSSAQENDLLDFRFVNFGITVDLNETGAFGSDDSIQEIATGHFLQFADSSINNVQGTHFDDTIVGNDNDNDIKGRGGADTILGLGGNDTINGGGGANVINGGSENDTLSGAGELTGGNGIDTFAGQQEDPNVSNPNPAQFLDWGDLTGGL